MTPDVSTMWILPIFAALAIIRHIRSTRLANTASAESHTSLPTKFKKSDRDGDEYLGIFPSLGDVAEPMDMRQRREWSRTRSSTGSCKTSRIIQVSSHQPLFKHILIHAGAYESARERLIQLFDDTLPTASPVDPTYIASIPNYSSQALRDLMGTAHSTAADNYEAYLLRRKSGGPRELFPTKQHAHEWLRLAACVKYVDGSWVSGILLHLESNERKSAKMAWQVI